MQIDQKTIRDRVCVKLIYSGVAVGWYLCRAWSGRFTIVKIKLCWTERITRSGETCGFLGRVRLMREKCREIWWATNDGQVKRAEGLSEDTSGRSSELVSHHWTERPASIWHADRLWSSLHSRVPLSWVLCFWFLDRVVYNHTYRAAAHLLHRFGMLCQPLATWYRHRL